MTESQRAHIAVGCSSALTEQLSHILDAPFADAIEGPLQPGDLVFLSVESGDMPESGNAFSTCRALKRQSTGIKVFLVLPLRDSVSEEIARFCLADGCIRVDGSGALASADELAEMVDPMRRKLPVDALLVRLEAQLGDPARQASAFQKMAEEHNAGHFLDRLTDEETGLFDGPFASFKLDEELKRSLRFHHPLSLILLDCGAALPADATDRRTALAEIASVFLNECRDIDTLGRFTETTFMFLLPGTGSDGASMVASRMLEELRGRTFSGALELRPAAGIVSVPATGVSTRSDFLSRAEGCLEIAREEAGAARLCAL